MNTALTIAGSDSSGGAGIQVDLTTFFSLGVKGVSAITAVTAQNDTRVSLVHEVPAETVMEQIRSVIDGVDAAKTGMLCSAAIVEAVVDELKVPRLVVDPVMLASSGRSLLTEDGLSSMVKRLFPLATVITPNLDEASRLTGRNVDSVLSMRDAAKALHQLGPQYVLVKGGHLVGDAIDVLYDGTDFFEGHSPRIETTRRGTGCALSAAITAFLANGESVVGAVENAKSFMNEIFLEG
ncbi:MAG: bifunctional hydroxymethylpyrimidine kinase/phosphomethylpyrimidine kinase [Actinomycetota bacterium]